MKKVVFVVALSGLAWACSPKAKMVVSKVPDEPTYKLDRRLKAAQTSTTGLTGAVGPGTGGSYGGHNYRAQAYKLAKEKQNASVSPTYR